MKIVTKALLYNSQGQILVLPEAVPIVTLSWEHSAYFWLTPAELLARRLPKDADDYYLDVLDYLKKWATIAA